MIQKSMRGVAASSVELDLSLLCRHVPVLSYKCPGETLRLSTLEQWLLPVFGNLSKRRTTERLSQIAGPKELI